MRRRIVVARAHWRTDGPRVGIVQVRLLGIQSLHKNKHKWMRHAKCKCQMVLGGAEGVCNCTSRKCSWISYLFILLYQSSSHQFVRVTSPWTNFVSSLIKYFGDLTHLQPFFHLTYYAWFAIFGFYTGRFVRAAEIADYLFVHIFLRVFFHDGFVYYSFVVCADHKILQHQHTQSNPINFWYYSAREERQNTINRFHTLQNLSLNRTIYLTWWFYTFSYNSDSVLFV